MAGCIEYNLGMSDFFTTTGDDGTSGLLGKGRLPKDHPLFEAIGDIDEANAAFGIARASSKNHEIKEIILTIQRDLSKLMAELAATPENAERFHYIAKSHTSWIEEQINKIERGVNIPSEFIIPGATLASAHIDMARAIVRRAERKLSTLFHQKELNNEEILRYMNRLSSLCFILELWEIDGVPTTQTSSTNDR